jgi:hypothetical protein
MDFLGHKVVRSLAIKDEKIGAKTYANECDSVKSSESIFATGRLWNVQDVV